MNKISALLGLLLTAAAFLVTSCEGDSDSGPNVYFKATIRYNSTPPETYESSSYTYEARIDSLANDTLVFEGCRDNDDSYLFFNLITDDLTKYQAGDTITIAYDIDTQTEVFCSLLINSLSTTIFQPGFGTDQGEIIIDEIDYTKKIIAGRLECQLYSFNDTLTVTDAEFRIDE
jgi:hypothetical protein